MGLRRVCVSCDLRQVSEEKGKRGGGAFWRFWAGRREATALLCWLAITRRCAAVAALSCGVVEGTGATGGQ